MNSNIVYTVIYIKVWMPQIICAQGSHRGEHPTQNNCYNYSRLHYNHTAGLLSWLVKVWEVPGSSLTFLYRNFFWPKSKMKFFLTKSAGCRAQTHDPKINWLRIRKKYHSARTWVWVGIWQKKSISVQFVSQSNL